MSNLEVNYNPYQHVYRNAGLPILKDVNKKEAEELVRHLGYIYNTFGIVMKDFIKVVSTKFQEKEQNSNTAPTVPKNFFQSKKENKPIFEEYNYEPAQSSLRRGEENREKERKSNLFSKDHSKEGFKAKTNDKDHFSLELQNYSYNVELNSVGTGKNSAKMDEKKEKKTSDYIFGQLLSLESGKTQIQQKKNSKKSVEGRKEGIEEKEENKKENQGGQIEFSSEILRSQNQQTPSEFQFSNFSQSSKSLIRVLPGRSKKQRDQYKGIACGDCQKFYKTIGIQQSEMCQCTSRHKSNLPMRRFENNHYTQEFNLD